ncbi:MAG: enoyl-CoA hydratase/isomerase family protein [Perlucidibaca sp.]
MSYLELTREGAVWLLTLNHGDNRFNDASLDAWDAALDRIEAEPGNAALVITSADPKFFSNGIDLDHFLGEGGPGPAYLRGTFVARLDAFLLRMARFPLPVVMAINGHAYAGGALLAATGDVRLMRADRGRLCFPEVDIKLPLTEIMTEIVRLLPNAGTAWQMASTGLALGGDEAVARGVIDQALGEAELLPAAMRIAAALAQKDRATYAVIKRRWRSAFERFGGDR